VAFLQNEWFGKNATLSGEGDFTFGFSIIMLALRISKKITRDNVTLKGWNDYRNVQINTQNIPERVASRQDERFEKNAIPLGQDDFAPGSILKQSSVNR
jgi:hypothetical protein